MTKWEKRLTCRFCGVLRPSPPTLWSGWAQSAARWCSRCPALRGHNPPVQTALCKSPELCGWQRSKAGDRILHHLSAEDTDSTCAGTRGRGSNWGFQNILKMQFFFVILWFTSFFVCVNNVNSPCDVLCKLGWIWRVKLDIECKVPGSSWGGKIEDV